jgi:hypothetical protein
MLVMLFQIFFIRRTSNLKDKNDRPPAAPAGSAAADSQHYNVAISSLSSPLLQRSPAPVQRWLDSPLAGTATTGVQVYKTYSVTVREKNHVLSREQRFPTNWFSDFWSAMEQNCLILKSNTKMVTYQHRFYGAGSKINPIIIFYS